MTPIQDDLAELRSLEGLARTLAAATACEGSPGAHAMAQALKTRIVMLSGRISRDVAMHASEIMAAREGVGAGANGP